DGRAGRRAVFLVGDVKHAGADVANGRRDHQRTSSIDGDAGVLDDLAPLLELGVDPRGELVRWARNGIGRRRLEEFVAEAGIGEYLLSLGTKLVDDLARRALGRGETVPGAGLIARNGLGD